MIEVSVKNVFQLSEVSVSKATEVELLKPGLMRRRGRGRVRPGGCCWGSGERRR